MFSTPMLICAVLCCQNYRAVLLISDIYHRRHVRELLDVLLQRLGFAAVFVVQVFEMHLVFKIRAGTD